MKKVFILIIVQSLGFFPYMPAMHAEESVLETNTHHHEASQCCHDCGDKESHDMQDCISAVHDILGTSSSLTYEIPKISGVIIPFWQKESIVTKKYSILSYSKSQDPPFFTSHSLIGIVKILS